MKKVFALSLLFLVCLATTAGAITPRQLERVEQLKKEAVTLMREGKFEQAAPLLNEVLGHRSRRQDGCPAPVSGEAANHGALLQGCRRRVPERGLREGHRDVGQAAQDEPGRPAVREPYRHHEEPDHGQDHRRHVPARRTVHQGQRLQVGRERAREDPCSQAVRPAGPQFATSRPRATWSMRAPRSTTIRQMHT